MRPARPTLFTSCAAGGTGGPADAEGLHRRQSAAQRLCHRTQSRTCRGLRDDRTCCARVNEEELAGVLAHELGHVKNRDTLTMTITATIAGAVSMLANFAFFFGGAAQSAGLCRHAAGDDAGAHRRRAGADDDQPDARIRSRPRGRGDFRPSALAGLCAGAHRSRRADAPTIRRPTPIPRRRICSSSIRCMAGCRDCSPAIPRPKNASRGLRAMARDRRRYSRSLGDERTERRRRAAPRKAILSDGPCCASTGLSMLRWKIWPTAPRDAGFARAIASETLRASARSRR